MVMHLLKEGGGVMYKEMMYYQRMTYGLDTVYGLLGTSGDDANAVIIVTDDRRHTGFYRVERGDIWGVESVFYDEDKELCINKAKKLAGVA